MKWPQLPKVVRGLAGPIGVVRPRSLGGEDDSVTLGTWSFRGRSIAVLAGLSRERAWHVLLHEYVHAIADDAGLNLPNRLVEPVADAVASGMLNLLRAIFNE